MDVDINKARLRILVCIYVCMFVCECIRMFQCSECIYVWLFNIASLSPLAVTTVALDFSEDMLASSARFAALREVAAGDCSEWFWVSVSEPPW